MMKTRALTFCFMSGFVLLLSMSAMAQTPTQAAQTSDAAHTLSEVQKQALRQIHIDSEKQAAPVALRLAEIVHKVYENMLADQPDEQLRTRLSAEMRDITWELLSIKGQAIRAMVSVLTPEQRQLIKSELSKPGAPADLSEVIAHTFKLTDK
jgi:uncharacterized membrane protein